MCDVIKNFVKLGYYRTDPKVSLPTFGTQLSTCFDLCYCPSKTSVEGYNKDNDPFDRPVGAIDAELTISPGDRVLIPTGLIFRIIDEKLAGYEHQVYSIRLHARSGLSLKRGLVLANSEGIVDVDYQEEVFVLLTNISNQPQIIKRYDRIAQAEIIKNEQFVFFEYPVKPERLSNRSAGFGSTGTK
jgi:dUTP pyrophosphatase